MSRTTRPHFLTAAHDLCSLLTPWERPVSRNIPVAAVELGVVVPVAAGAVEVARAEVAQAAERVAVPAAEAAAALAVARVAEPAAKVEPAERAEPETRAEAELAAVAVPRTQGISTTTG